MLQRLICSIIRKKFNEVIFRLFLLWKARCCRLVRSCALAYPSLGRTALRKASNAVLSPQALSWRHFFSALLQHRSKKSGLGISGAGHEEDSGSLERDVILAIAMEGAEKPEFTSLKARNAS